MFSWKKQNPPSQQRQQRQTSGATGDYSDLIAHGMQLAHEDIDHGDGDDDDMGEGLDEDLGDIDLDDPELLVRAYFSTAGERGVVRICSWGLISNSNTIHSSWARRLSCMD